MKFERQSTALAIPRQKRQDRIHNQDTLRGVAVLGILIMNGVSFGLGTTAVFNVSFDTDAFSIGRSIAIAGEIVAEQKFMALFSILFGAGIVLFHERLTTRHGNTKAVRISLWRNTLLLLMGIIHNFFWDGDVLLIYAISAPLILAARNLPIVALFASGIGILLLSPISVLAIHLYIDAQGQALGMMLIGIGLYRTGFLSGTASTRLYRFTALSGTAIGWLLAACGVMWISAEGFTTDVALLGGIPNSLGTLPAALGYIAIITLSAQHMPKRWLHRIAMALCHTPTTFAASKVARSY
ncbi:MAG: hypothetical protein ACI9UN_004941 [Granulosicoccus sp.]|jgi:uncharacterized protein